MSLERMCSDNSLCVNGCGSGPCSRQCQVCQRLAGWASTPCPACPDFATQKLPEISTSEHLPEGTILLAPIPPLCPQNARHGHMELLIRRRQEKVPDPVRQRFLEPPVYACGSCMARLPGDWAQFGLITGNSLARIPEAAPEQVPVEVVKNEPPQIGLHALLAQKSRRAKPDPGSLRLELRAHAMVHTRTGPGTGETVTSRAMWSTAIGVSAQIVLCWTEHGGEYEATIAEAAPADEGVKDISQLVSVTVRPADG